MKLNIRPLEAGDYDSILVDWWNDWRWTAPAKDFLPENVIKNTVKNSSSAHVFPRVNLICAMGSHV